MSTRDFKRMPTNDIARSPDGSYHTVTGDEYIVQRIGLLIDETVGEVRGGPLTRHDAKQVASRVESRVEQLPETTGTTVAEVAAYSDESVTLTVKTSELTVEVSSS